MTCPPRRFTVPSGAGLARSLVSRLIPVVDTVRDLRVGFGCRPYRVRIVRTRWTGGRRGDGHEVVTHERELLPVPLVSDLSGLGAVVNPAGLAEVGTIVISEISGSYTEDDLRGYDDDGSPAGADEQVFYEIMFPRPNIDGLRRRFTLVSAPAWEPLRFQWTARLERARQDRDRGGGLR